MKIITSMEQIHQNHVAKMLHLEAPKLPKEASKADSELAEIEISLSE